MSDSARVINTLSSRLMNILAGQLDGGNLCFSPSTLYVTLLAVQDLLNTNYNYKELVDADVPSDVDDEEFDVILDGIPSLEIGDNNTVLKTWVKLFLAGTGGEETTPRNHFHSTFGVTHRWHASEECDDIQTRLIRWVSKRTSKDTTNRVNMVEEINPGSNSMVIGNHVEFSATWLFPIDPADTCERRFYISEDNFKEVEMMYVRESLRVSLNTDFDVETIELPLTNPDLSVLILQSASKESSILSLLENFNELLMDDCISLMEFENAAVLLPKFKLNSTTDMMRLLHPLDIITREASDDASKYDLLQYLHSVPLVVNESGICAKLSSRKIPFHDEEYGATPLYVVDRPFLFVIYDSYYRCCRAVAAIVEP